VPAGPQFDDAYHYPPEVLNLLVDVIPLLCRSKKDVITFFRSAGVGEVIVRPWESRLRRDRDSVYKHEIARDVLSKVNEAGDSGLAARREIIKRIVDRDDFSTCWPDDQLPARGLVAQLRQVVNRKDSFTRMNIERENEERKRRAEREAIEARKAQDLEVRRRAKEDLFALFSEKDPHKRARGFEEALNKLFAAFDIRVRDAFTRRSSEGIPLEQVDGVVRIDSHFYLVEAKWCRESIGTPEISQHVSRLFLRAEARGIVISESDFTSAAIDECKNALQHKVVVLCQLREICQLLEAGGDLVQMLRRKIEAAVVDREPLYWAA
jgi:restriction system protein